MPLQVTNDAPSAVVETLKSTATTSQPAFLVVYASLTNGRSWCGDCRQAEPFINKKFESKPEAVRIVYAGQSGEWRNPSNPWREEPFSVTNLPTLIKVTAGGKWSQLVEVDVYDQKKLDAFVGE